MNIHGSYRGHSNFDDTVKKLLELSGHYVGYMEDEDIGLQAYCPDSFNCFIFPIGDYIPKKDMTTLIIHKDYEYVIGYNFGNAEECFGEMDGRNDFLRHLKLEDYECVACANDPKLGLALDAYLLRELYFKCMFAYNDYNPQKIIDTWGLTRKDLS